MAFCGALKRNRRITTASPTGAGGLWSETSCGECERGAVDRAGTGLHSEEWFLEAWRRGSSPGDPRRASGSEPANQPWQQGGGRPRLRPRAPCNSIPHVAPTTLDLIHTHRCSLQGGLRATASAMRPCHPTSRSDRASSSSCQCFDSSDPLIPCVHTVSQCRSHARGSKLWSTTIGARTRHDADREAGDKRRQLRATQRSKLVARCCKGSSGTASLLFARAFDHLGAVASLRYAMRSGSGKKAGRQQHQSQAITTKPAPTRNTATGTCLPALQASLARQRPSWCLQRGQAGASNA